MLFTTESFIQADGDYRHQRISEEFARASRRVRRAPDAVDQAEAIARSDLIDPGGAPVAGFYRPARGHRLTLRSIVFPPYA